MNKIRLAILGASDIAFRRFLPALKKDDRFFYVGVASRTPEKASAFVSKFGGTIFSGYDAASALDDIDAVYLPLPPALHFEWARKALLYDKHVFLEKPSTTNASNTAELVKLAENKRLALKENYMFLHHAQLREINVIVNSGQIGVLRLIRIAFGFPKRPESDFRYNKDLGGGALLDCGGYTLRLASEFLGESAKVTTASLTHEKSYGVDIAGSATLRNEMGLVAQVSFGMDNSYKCELELWGSKGCIISPRIFTAPGGFVPTVELQTADGKTVLRMPEDDQFLGSIRHFYDCILDSKTRKESYAFLLRQSKLVEDVRLNNE
ncbi:oxidoreductase [Synergistales bacterium]|nr:oxidoreductase [Synergistales bacterium]